MGFRALTGLALALVLPLAACGGGDQKSNPPTATAERQALARGVVAALPDATLLISVSDVWVPAGGSAADATPGILYVVAGSATVPGTGDVSAGNAAFLNPQPRLTLTNGGSVAAEWYLFAVEPSSSRSGPTPLGGATRIFATDDLPPLPRLNQAEALTHISLKPNAQVDQYRPNGVEVLLGLAGRSTVRSDSFHGAQVLVAGKAGYELEGTQMLVLNHGSAAAGYLSFILLPDGTALTRPGR